MDTLLYLTTPYFYKSKNVEIILTIFKGSADQQCVDAKTYFTFLGHDNLFSQIYMTRLKDRHR